MNIPSKLQRALLAIGKVALTVAVALVAIVAGRQLWRHYQVEPWTRDGRVRADVVEIAADVSGLVTRVEVANDQPVKQGQPLFYIDRDRFELALRQANAAVAAQRVSLDQAKREAKRNHTLGELVAGETTEQGDSKVAQSEAGLAQALVAKDLAALNLHRTVVFAPADGFLSDLTIRAGDYVTAGRPVLALIDAHSLRVEGYFEETKLRGVHVGQEATVRLMGDGTLLHGHVQSIAPGIEDRERGASSSLLPNVNPTFSWVRLAQRIPVRISLDRVPGDVRLIAGRTATVAIVERATTKVKPQ
jgi:multidrug resistance efflux pump